MLAGQTREQRTHIAALCLQASKHVFLVADMPRQVLLQMSAQAAEGAEAPLSLQTSP